MVSTAFNGQTFGKSDSPLYARPGPPASKLVATMLPGTTLGVPLYAVEVAGLGTTGAGVGTAVGVAVME
eukprot:6264-Heterococcus_DN1.PRE.4